MMARCFYLSILLLSLLCGSIYGKRHTIYWDDSIMPGLKEELRIEVNVNDWMDVLCPHKSTYNRSSPDASSLYLELYNVSSEHYKNCVVTGQKRLLHCRDPRQEVKLTTKFQTRSPSPIGFVFRPGHTYYYISKPAHKAERGCTSHTMRMQIFVKDRRKNTHRKEPPARKEDDKKDVTSTPKQEETQRSLVIPPLKEPSLSEPQASPSSKNKTPDSSAMSPLRCKHWTVTWFVTSCMFLLKLLFSNDALV